MRETDVVAGAGPLDGRTGGRQGGSARPQIGLASALAPQVLDAPRSALVGD
jgi:hypothetical protein